MYSQRMSKLERNCWKLKSGRSKAKRELFFLSYLIGNDAGERLKNPFEESLIRPVFASFPGSESCLIDSQSLRQVLLREAMYSPIFPYFVSQILRSFLERIAAQEFDDLRNLGQRGLNPVLFPEVNREVRNIKLEGKLAFGELRIDPPDPDPVAPRPTKIRVFLPGNRLFCP
jgi:hypothetical protein